MIFILPSTNKMQNNFTVFLFHFFDDNLWFCRTPVLSLGLGVDFFFAWDNKNNNIDKNPHLNFLKGAVPVDKERGVGIRDKGIMIRDKT